MSYRFMRVILFFDLPNVTKKENREYVKFVKLIKQNGFVMMQESVYTKLCLNQSIVNSTMGILKKQLPPNGMISTLTITENQFASIETLVGEMETDVIMTDERFIKL